MATELFPLLPPPRSSSSLIDHNLAFIKPSTMLASSIRVVARSQVRTNVNWYVSLPAISVFPASDTMCIERTRATDQPRVVCVYCRLGRALVAIGRIDRTVGLLAIGNDNKTAVTPMPIRVNPKRPP